MRNIYSCINQHNNNFRNNLGNVTMIFAFIKVSDVNDDVRRAAVESIGFILFR